jgi:hypothetical protein
MNDWTKLFSSYLNSGVFDVTEGEKIGRIIKAAMVHQLDFVQIDLATACAKADFLGAVSKALHFPSTFGLNWDALSDFLTDLSWRPAPGYVILLTNFQTFCHHELRDTKILKQILNSSAQYWRQRAVRFYIILSEKSSRTP